MNRLNDDKLRLLRKKTTQERVDRMVFPEDPSHPKANEVWVRDSEQRGLFIVFRRSGVHSYVFKATIPCLGKADPFTIGKTNCVSLAYARQFTKKCHEHLKEGKNPRFSVTGLKKPAEVRYVKDLFDDYIAELKKRGLAESTLRNRRHSFNKYMPETIKNNVLSSLTRAEIEICINKISKVHAANQFILHLRTFLNWCIHWDLLQPDSNFTNKIKLHKALDSSRRNYGMLLENEEEVFVETLQELVEESRGKRGQTRTYQGAIFIELLYWLGCRPCELFIIKKNQIYEHSAGLWMIKFFGKGKHRTVRCAVPTRLLGDIKILGALKTSDSVLWSWASDTTGKKVLIQTWHKKVLPLYRRKLQERGIVENNPLKIPYDLRHHSQTRWHHKGGNLEACANWHGNSVAVAKKNYVNFTPDQQAEQWVRTKLPTDEKLSAPESITKQVSANQGGVWVLNVGQLHSPFTENPPGFISPNLESKEFPNGWALTTQTGFGTA